MGLLEFFSPRLDQEKMLEYFSKAPLYIREDSVLDSVTFG